MSNHTSAHIAFFASLSLTLSCLAAPALAQVDQNAGRYGGTLTIGKVGVGALVLHPLYISLSVEREIVDMVYGYGLLRWNRNGQLVYGLAAPPTRVGNGYEWIFRLHPGIRFHDGYPLTAADVVFTYELYKQSRTYDPIFHRYFRNLAAVRRVDDRTVIFAMKEPVSEFPNALATLPVVPKYQFETRTFADMTSAPAPPQPIGLGPYKVDTRQTRDMVTLTANGSWSFGRPYIDRIVYRFYSSSEELQAAFVLQEVDMIDVDRASSFHELKRARPDAKIQAVLPRHQAFEAVFYNNTHPLLTDGRIRRALTYAIDRSRIVNQVMLPDAGRMAHGPVDENFWAFGGGTRLKYDPARALALLHEAGWRDSDQDGVLDQGKIRLQFDLYFPSGSVTAEKVVRIIKLNLNDIGVDVRPTPVEMKELVQRLRIGAYEAALVTQPFESTPDDFYAVFHSESIPLGFNMLGYRNRQVDRNISFLYGISEQARALPIYQQLQALISQDQPCTFLYFIERQYIAFDPRVQNVGTPGAALNTPNTWYLLADPR